MHFSNIIISNLIVFTILNHAKIPANVIYLQYYIFPRFSKVLPLSKYYMLGETEADKYHYLILLTSHIFVYYLKRFPVQHHRN